MHGLSSNDQSSYSDSIHNQTITSAQKPLLLQTRRTKFSANGQNSAISLTTINFPIRFHRLNGETLHYARPSKDFSLYRFSGSFSAVCFVVGSDCLYGQFLAAPRSANRFSGGDGVGFSCCTDREGAEEADTLGTLEVFLKDGLSRPYDLKSVVYTPGEKGLF